MSPWVLRGLRDGVVTTRWPARPDAYADGWRGPAAILDPRPGDAAGLPSVCPTGAITTRADGALCLDQGRCILCGRCVEVRPDVFGWSSGPADGALTRSGLVVPEISETDENVAAVRVGLAARTMALRRSVHLRHVDAGSDGAEEQEIMALLNPVYDIHRLGIFFTASPRHADVLLVTGAGAHGMAEPLRRTYTGMPDPKIVIAVGTDAVSGGLLGGSNGSTGPWQAGDGHAATAGGGVRESASPAGTAPQSGSYATSGGVDSLVPVDVWVPGSPPPPFSILHALLLGLGRLPRGERTAGARR
jgi:Ni,Fe-hydrogenase III small subunit/ferredoxin